MQCNIQNIFITTKNIGTFFSTIELKYFARTRNSQHWYQDQEKRRAFSEKSWLGK